MRILFLYILSTFVFAAQVTFNVDMSTQDVGSEGPTLWMGHLYPEPGFIMTDENDDGIWSFIVELEPGTYTYKYRNGHWPSWNDGAGWEEVPSECEVGQWGDREVVVSDQDISLDVLCFNSCDSECVEVIYSNVTFQVDMSDQILSDSDVVYVQGTFNGWCGYCNPMSDINEDDIWELTIEIPTGEYEYLFTTQGWDGLQGNAPIGSDCDWLVDDIYGNYGFILEEQDLLLGPYCFGTCWDTCQTPAVVDITFHVDMNNEESIDDVYMIGNFQTFPWQTVFQPTVMDDLDGDGIYSVTITALSDDLIEYKFVNGSDIESNAGIGSCGNNPNLNDCESADSDCNNREFQVPSCEINENGECVLDALDAGTSFFDSCNIVLADAHFSIDLSNTDYPNEDYDQCGLNGSWNAVGYEWLGWGLTLSDDDGDNIFTGSLNGLAPGDYEFVVFCSGPADGYSGWGMPINSPVGSECDFDTSDEYGNYGFTIVDSDIDISYCAGTCDEVCNGGEPSETHQVTFDIDGLDDCDFMSITGSFSNWDGWGATNDNDWTIDLVNGEYEFTILCVDTQSNAEWYNDIWGASTQYEAPWGSNCDFIQGDDYPNYGFIVDGEDLTVSYCAGTCDEVCDSNDCNNNGDVNFDQIINVVDVVAIVGYVLGSGSDIESCIADLNGDGIVNVVDIVAIVTVILGD